MYTESGDILQLVRQHFPEIAEKGLQEEIAEAGKIFHYRAGEVIMDYGSYVKLVPLVIEGSIKVVREDEGGNELFLYFLEAGNACTMSFSCCMMDKKSIIRAEAEEDVTFIGIPVRKMDEWMRKYQSWKNFVMMSYDYRMTELVRTIDRIAFQKMDERLLDYLRKKSDTANSKLIKATHQDSAASLNSSREAVSRLLKQLEHMGKVRLGRNSIELIETQ